MPANQLLNPTFGQTPVSHQQFHALNSHHALGLSPEFANYVAPPYLVNDDTKRKRRRKRQANSSSSSTSQKYQDDSIELVKSAHSASRIHSPSSNQNFLRGETVATQSVESALVVNGRTNQQDSVSTNNNKQQAFNSQSYTNTNNNNGNGNDNKMKKKIASEETSARSSGDSISSTTQKPLSSFSSQSSSQQQQQQPQKQQQNKATSVQSKNNQLQFENLANKRKACDVSSGFFSA